MGLHQELEALKREADKMRADFEAQDLQERLRQQRDVEKQKLEFDRLQAQLQRERDAEDAAHKAATLSVSGVVHPLTSQLISSAELERGVLRLRQAAQKLEALKREFDAERERILKEKELEEQRQREKVRGGITTNASLVGDRFELDLLPGVPVGCGDAQKGGRG